MLQHGRCGGCKQTQLGPHHDAGLQAVWQWQVPTPDAGRVERHRLRRDARREHAVDDRLPGGDGADPGHDDRRPRQDVKGEGQAHRVEAQRLLAPQARAHVFRDAVDAHGHVAKEVACM